MSPIIPLAGWVVIKPIESEDIKSKTGIILQEKLPEEKKNLGEVVAVPSKSPVIVGCTIFYKPYAHIDCLVDGEKYLLVEIQDLCGVVKKEEFKSKTESLSPIAFEEQGI
jgi:co-chaperonin GroES (HSP10)